MKIIRRNWVSLFGFVLIPYLAIANESRSFEFDFNVNNNGWTGEFSNYWVNREMMCKLSWGWMMLPTTIPPNIDDTFNGPAIKYGIYLAGMNRPDDLFMFVKRQVEGLSPNTVYSLDYTVLIESNIGLDTDAGIGGQPGRSVLFKVGASAEEPKKIIDEQNNYYVLNVDKGNHRQEGSNAVIIGDLVNPAVSHRSPKYLPLRLKQQKPLLVETDANGKLWLFLGTDSGYEGFTAYYIAKIDVIATKVN